LNQTWLGWSPFKIVFKPYLSFKMKATVTKNRSFFNCILLLYDKMG
jgi:hypothetical protein